MKVAIVEDNHDDIYWLKNIFKEYNNRLSSPIYIEYYSSGKQLLHNFSFKKYDLIIMDIYMDGMDGIETAQCVQRIDEDVLIAFLTTSDDDIWRAVKTHSCFDYMQKQTFNIKRLEKLLHDVYKKLKVQDEALIFLNGKQEVKIRLKDIHSIIANDKYTIFTLRDQICKYRITFSNIYELIKKRASFILCNRGIILNMDFILRTDGDIFIMIDQTKHPIRRRGRKEITDKFISYQFQKLDNQEIL